MPTDWAALIATARANAKPAYAPNAYSRGNGGLPVTPSATRANAVSGNAYAVSGNADPSGIGTAATTRLANATRVTGSLANLRATYGANVSVTYIARGLYYAYVPTASASGLKGSGVSGGYVNPSAATVNRRSARLAYLPSLTR